MLATILDSAILVFPLKLTHTCQYWFPPFEQKKLHSHFPPHHLHKKLHSFILTQLDDGSHLEFWHLGFSSCHLGFRHLVIFSQIHSKPLSLHSDSELNLIQTDKLDDGRPSWILPSWILSSWIQPFCTILWLKLIQSDLNSFILTQLDEVSHLEFCHLGFSHFGQKKFTHSFWLNLMMAAILNSAM